MRRTVWMVILALSGLFLLATAGCSTEPPTAPELSPNQSLIVAGCPLCAAGQVNHPGPHQRSN